MKENPDIRDTYLGGSDLCMRPAGAVPPRGKRGRGRYRKNGGTRYEQSLAPGIPRDMQNQQRVLAEGMYHRSDGGGKCVIWGDYFYMEAAGPHEERSGIPYW